MRHRTVERDAAELARQDVRRVIEAAHVRVPRGRDAAVGPRARRSLELDEHLVGARRLAEARRVRRDERREVDRVEQRRLEQLADGEQALDEEERDPRKTIVPSRTAVTFTDEQSTERNHGQNAELGVLQVHLRA